jgi:hypothetical protein
MTLSAVASFLSSATPKATASADASAPVADRAAALIEARLAHPQVKDKSPQAVCSHVAAELNKLGYRAAAAPAPYWTGPALAAYLAREAGKGQPAKGVK